VHPGQPIRIIHEPDNPHDEMALRVETADGDTLGYLPRKCGLRVAVHQHGRGLSGAIASVGWSRACLLGATVSIALSDDEVRTQSYYPNRPTPEAPPGGFRYWVTSPADVARLVAARK
jgi:hypothetical protein